MKYGFQLALVTVLLAIFIVNTGRLANADDTMIIYKPGQWGWTNMADPPTSGVQDFSNINDIKTYYYVPMFQPKNEQRFWPGDIKKWEILDLNFNVTDGAASLSVGAELKARTDRRIYMGSGVTLITNTTPAPAGVCDGAVWPSGTCCSVDPPVCSGAAQELTKWKEIINHLYGYDRALTGIKDPFDADGDSNVNDAREWVLGSIIHSKPLILRYNDGAESDAVIIVGANDAQIHAFNAKSGKELWSYIPQNMISRLKWMDPNKPLTRMVPEHPHLDECQPGLCKPACNCICWYDDTESGRWSMAGEYQQPTDIANSYMPFYVDGTPVLAHDDADNSSTINGGEKAFAIIGMRRGGECYVVLDVSAGKFSSGTPVPDLVAEICPSTPGFSKLGQTWSTPATFLWENDLYAAFGGGYHPEYYDTNIKTWCEQSNFSAVLGKSIPAGLDANCIGNKLYVVRLRSTGISLEKTFGWQGSTYNHVNMQFPIVAPVTAVTSDNYGKEGLMYVGDIGGQLWRMDINDPVGGATFRPLVTEVGSGALTIGNSHPIYHAADVTLGFTEGLSMSQVYVGTGDRTRPYLEGVTSYFVGVVDVGSQTVSYQELLNEVDITSTALSAFNWKGWILHLNMNGEKSLSDPFVSGGFVFFSTFKPSLSVAAGVNPPVFNFPPGASYFYMVDYEGIADFGNQYKSSGIIEETALPSSPQEYMDSKGNTVIKIGSPLKESSTVTKTITVENMEQLVKPGTWGEDVTLPQ